MAAIPLLDTDVMIDYLRRRTEAVTFMRSLSARPVISAITVGELYTGVREGQERTDLERVLGAFRVIPVTQAIAINGGLYRRQFRTSHGLHLADALIAATADFVRADLYTLNIKHYPMFASINPAYVK